MTLSIMGLFVTFSIKTHHFLLVCHYAECRDYFSVILSVVMLKVVMLSVIMLSVVMLGVVMLSVVILSVVLESALKM